MLTFDVFKNTPVNFSLTMVSLSRVDMKKGAIWRLFCKNGLKSSFLYVLRTGNYFLPKVPKRFLNLSTRPPVSITRCLPV